MSATKPHSMSPSPEATSASPNADFLRLAHEQGVHSVARLEDLMGGWPVEERNDGFEASLMEWRNLQVPSRS